MKIEENVSLRSYNTFGIDVQAKRFVSVRTEDELVSVLRNHVGSKFIISGGSNMVLTRNLDCLVIHINIKGISTQFSPKPGHIRITAKAGENWHEFVLYCITNGYGGLENLSLIPGCVGSSPIQNIGAYGVEIKDTFVKCAAINIDTGERRVFSAGECQFGYRDSIFKHKVKGQYIITEVTYELSTDNHQYNTSYGAIESQLRLTGRIDSPDLQSISDAVIAIRQSKLPDPKILGNSGSFFKNPIVPKIIYEKLQQQFPTMPHYPVSPTEVKVPAGWLIEQSGLKGKRFGEVGVHEKQALVLVNYGKGTGQDIANLARKIQQMVKDKFEIELEIEVNIIENC